MPPKRGTKGKSTKGKTETETKSEPETKKTAEKVDLDYSLEDADDHVEEADHADQVEDEKDDLPDLTDLSKIKERYEYKPVVSQEIIILHPDQRRTSDVMTMFEYTNIISQRATQINNGGECYTDTANLTDPIEMARKELHDKRCPLMVQRGVTDKIFELWTANELAIPIEARVNAK